MSDEFEFYTPAPRFDKEAAADGVWHTVDDENGEVYVEVKMLLMDNDNPRWTARRDRWKRANREGKDKEAYFRKMVAHVAVVDWKLKDPKGKPVEYTGEKADYYFSKVSFAYESCLTFATDVKNFVEADLGNSSTT